MELRERERNESLSAKDFTCLEFFPAPRGTEMFTVLKGTLHCEVSPGGGGMVPYIFVTEPRDLPLLWVDLSDTNFVIRC